MTDAQKIREFLNKVDLHCEACLTTYHTDCNGSKDAKTLLGICHNLLDACEKASQLEIYFHSYGSMYDPFLGINKTIFENKERILNPSKEALETCAKEIEE